MLKKSNRTGFVILSEAKNLVLPRVETLDVACPEGDPSVASLLQNDIKRSVQGDVEKQFFSIPVCFCNLL